MPLDNPLPERPRARRYAPLGWLAVAAVAIIFWLARPFVMGMLLGALMAFTLEPLYEREVRSHGRPILWALTAVITTGVLVLAVAVGFVTLFVTRLAGFATDMRKALSPGGALAMSLGVASQWLSRHGLSISSLISRLENAAGEIASRSAVIAGAVAAGTFSALLGLFFAMLTMYLVLLYWPQMVSAAAAVSPFAPKHTRIVLAEFKRAGRETLTGTVVTGIAQGLFAGIGFWISGVPQPAFFGAATAVASLLPGVGTLLVWVPVGIFLIATGHVGKAILELTWCALTVVALSDYVIKPKLVGDENTPALLVYIALFGGVEVLGLAGLIIGPILMALAVAALRLYSREKQNHFAT
jgi:predicted PurR-regulated permease PerM